MFLPAQSDVKTISLDALLFFFTKTMLLLSRIIRQKIISRLIQFGKEVPGTRIDYEQVLVAVVHEHPAAEQSGAVVQAEQLAEVQDGAGGASGPCTWSSLIFSPGVHVSSSAFQISDSELQPHG